jgi:hypothetical protein
MRLSKRRKNYAIAQTSGFPVFYSPYVLIKKSSYKRLSNCSVHLTDWWWLMIYPIVLPLLKLFPSSWQNPWLQYAYPLTHS